MQPTATSGSTRTPRLSCNSSVLALTAAGATIGLMAAFSSDAMISKGFAVALQSEPAVLARTEGAAAEPPVAGSEDFWLSHESAPPTRDGADIALTAWGAPVKLGATLTLTLSGQPRTLEVVEIAELDAGVTRVETGSSPARPVIVSCREVGKPDGAMVRFIVEPAAGRTARQVAVVPARSLSPDLGTRTRPRSRDREPIHGDEWRIA
ncbi:MAG: hypothetical protein ACT4N2_03450 [Hyphomicrobium sp.]